MNERTICTSCRHVIPLTNHHLIQNNEAHQKFYGRLPVEHASAFCYFHKKGIVQEMIHKLKYKGEEEIGSVLGSWYSEELRSLSSFTKFDIIVPVPLHKKRLKERGYNQVTTFGKALSEGLSIPYDDSLLQRNVYAKTQTKKNLLARSISEKSVFGVTFSNEHHNKHFLLIDDVLTTGATLEACGRALLEIPGSRVSVACMAMSHS
ncbi:MAG TPA: phosphoribosyltransferase family protein [Flavobacterium sp.]|jgi:ComF family protein